VCTVTVVPFGRGFRVSCNRDERRDRPIAAPPMMHSVGRRKAMFPVDPASQGTWVGVNDRGLAVALLNRTAESIGALDTIDPAPRVSRGRIVPTLLACDSLDEAIERCARLDIRDFARFRLLIIQNARIAIVTSDSRVLAHEVLSLSRPVMQTSSSLGDAVVEGPRRRLFERLFGQQQDAWLRAQRRFHRHQWRSRPDISVMMQRADARTVSQTVIDVRAHSIDLAYRAMRWRTPAAQTIAV